MPSFWLESYSCSSACKLRDCSNTSHYFFSDARGLSSGLKRRSCAASSRALPSNQPGRTRVCGWLWSLKFIYVVSCLDTFTMPRISPRLITWSDGIKMIPRHESASLPRSSSMTACHDQSPLKPFIWLWRRHFNDGITFCCCESGDGYWRLHIGNREDSYPVIGERLCWRNVVLRVDGITG